MRRRLQERVNQHQAEMETLNRTKHELLEGKTKINDIINKLEKEEVCRIIYNARLFLSEEINRFASHRFKLNTNFISNFF